MKRRQFVAGAVKLALGSSASTLLGGAIPVSAAEDFSPGNFSDQQVRSLVVLTRAMFPYRQLDDSYYLDIIKHLDAQGDESAELIQLITDGLAQLDEVAGSPWLDASVDDKLKLMEEVQQEPFFGAVLNNAIDVLFRNPDVWELVGYEGSSIEYGGYLNRGFDDIDWLPPQAGT